MTYNAFFMLYKNVIHETRYMSWKVIVIYRCSKFQMGYLLYM